MPQVSQNMQATSQQSHVVYDDGLRAHIMFTRNTAASNLDTMLAHQAGTSSNLVYNGGPIQTAPKVYAIFWGSSWNSTTGDPHGMRSYLLAFYGKASGGKWLATVTQYYQGSGTSKAFVGPGMTVTSWIDTGSTPPSRPRQSNIAAEAARAASHFGDHSANASYVIVSPHGVKPQGFGSSYCAYHSSSSTSGGIIAYTNLPYIPDAGGACGAGSVNSPGTLDGVSIVGGHEQAETETDPRPNSGWLDSGGAEIGDKCAWIDLINNAAAGGYPTQPLWSNANSGCVQTY